MSEPQPEGPGDQGRAGKRRILVNASWLMSERALRVVVGFVVSTAVARHLGPQDLGLLSYAQSLVFVAAGLSGLGLEQILVRELVRDQTSRDRLLGTAFGLRLVGSALATGILFSVLVFTGDTRLVRILVLILSLGSVFDAFSVVDQYFAAQVAVGAAVRFRLVALLATSALRLLLVLVNADIDSLAWAQVVGSLLQAIGCMAVYQQSGVSMWRWRFSAPLGATLLKMSWPIAASGVVLHMQSRADQILMGRLLAPEALGNYSVAVRLTETLAVLPAVLITTLTPVIVEAHKNDQATYQRRLLQLHQVLALTAIAIGLAMIVFGPWAVRLVYGHEFELAGRLFAWCSIRILLAHVGSGRHVYFVTEGLLVVALRTMVIATFINIACNSVLIPRFGAYGAVAAMAISFSSLLVQDCFHPRTRLNLRLMLRALGTCWRVTPALLRGLRSD